MNVLLSFDCIQESGNEIILMYLIDKINLFPEISMKGIEFLKRIYLYQS